MQMPLRRFTLLAGVIAILAPVPGVTQPRSAPAPALAEARQFMQRAERELNALSIKASQAQWVADNFITDDTEALSADATKNLSVAVQRLAIASKRFDGATLPADLRRRFTLLKLALAAPPPGNEAEATELTTISASLQSDYGKGTYCRPATKAGNGSGGGGGGARRNVCRSTI